MEEWKKIKLSDVCDSISDGDHMPPPKSELGIPFITISNVKGNRIDFSDTFFVPQSYFDSLDEKRKPHKGDVLYTVVGSFGIPIYMRSDADFVFQRHIAILRPKETIDSRFLYYYLLNPSFYRIADQLAIGAVQRTIGLKALREQEILIPNSIDTQKRIASVLSSIDEKIELNNQINHNLEEQAQALYKSWFVDFEPFKDGEFIESELGMIPCGWHVGPLSEVATITMGQSPSGSSFNENGEGIIFYQGRTEFGNRFPMIRLFTTEPTRFAEPMSVLLSVRAPVGDINIARQKCCIGRGLASIYGPDHSFIYYTVDNLKPLLNRYNGEGTVFGSINRKDLESMSVIVPPNSVRNKFQDIVSNLDNAILYHSNENDTLVSYRDSLLPKLMSGEFSINSLDC